MKLACLHAHHTNIDYIESALATLNIELMHFVDPGLMNRVTNDTGFNQLDASIKVKEQIEWIAKCNADAILITCTNYIALLNEEDLSCSIPIIKIDEPYFEAICQIDEPQVILFTNPATIKGTMNRLNDYAEAKQKTLNLEVMVIEGTFELLMQGLNHEYNQLISTYIRRIGHDGKKEISVAQLSMVNAAKEIEREISKSILNPLDTLSSSVINQLAITKK
ncbi:hypothetical protein [Psychrobacillus sp. OK032]|uniref:hypothetical protein n=1 Tax=Psychrobacillus sp. OK032 TaxID=1884358 RepID=UPI0008B4FD75|nr:hypothetical protein [Psychrobacillus sp. OK032]SES10408.1 hypothetical protein SAMN05518872_104215 [Psychrobacillus sp. OK032]